MTKSSRSTFFCFLPNIIITECMEYFFSVDFFFVSLSVLIFLINSLFFSSFFFVFSHFSAQKKSTFLFARVFHELFLVVFPTSVVVFFSFQFFFCICFWFSCVEIVRTNTWGLGSWQWGVLWGGRDDILDSGSLYTHELRALKYFFDDFFQIKILACC